MKYSSQLSNFIFRYYITYFTCESVLGIFKYQNWKFYVSTHSFESTVTYGSFSNARATCENIFANCRFRFHSTRVLPLHGVLKITTVSARSRPVLFTLRHCYIYNERNVFHSKLVYCFVTFLLIITFQTDSYIILYVY